MKTTHTFAPCSRESVPGSAHRRSLAFVWAAGHIFGLCSFTLYVAILIRQCLLSRDFTRQFADVGGNDFHPTDRTASMDDVSLGVPKPLLESLPADGENAGADMKQAVTGWERRINAAIDTAETDREAAASVLEAIDRFESRFETYDRLIPELRAWGQSPIYAIAWRNLYADVIAQLTEHETLGEHIERERNARLVEDGIRLRDL